MDEKRLYELKINEVLEHVMPPLEEMEFSLLAKSLIEEGCRDKLIVWKETGEIVDGHNRYRICHENQIPFSYTLRSFEDEGEAKLWIIRNQLARRNLTPFVRCEMVIPLEKELKAEGKKHQARKSADFVLPNSAKQKESFNTRKEMAKIAGVAGDTIWKAKKLVESTDEETKEKLRNGSLSIHGAFTALKKKEDEILPGHTAEQILTPEMMGYDRPSDDVYDTPGISTYGNMPSDNKELRGRAEMVHARSSLEREMENHVRRVFEILKGMSSASINEENIATLKKIVTEKNNQIIDQLIRMEENSYEEE